MGDMEPIQYYKLREEIYGLSQMAAAAEHFNNLDFAIKCNDRIDELFAMTSGQDRERLYSLITCAQDEANERFVVVKF